jgi:hypothetical protein
MHQIDGVPIRTNIAVHDTPCMFWEHYLNEHGYGRVQRNHKHKFVHQIAWESVYGPVPKGFQIDHRCRNKSCYNIEHLRLATNTQNRANQAKRSGCASRFKGVVWAKPCQQWKAQIRAGGRVRFLGYFNDECEAAQAYDRASLELHGEFSVLNFPKAP